MIGIIINIVIFVVTPLLLFVFYFWILDKTPIYIWFSINNTELKKNLFG